MHDFNANLHAVRKHLVYSNPNRIGKLEFNGGTYEGEILDGQAHGEGVFVKEGDFPGTWTGTFREN